VLEGRLSEVGVGAGSGLRRDPATAAEGKADSRVAPQDSRRHMYLASPMGTCIGLTLMGEIGSPKALPVPTCIGPPSTNRKLVNQIRLVDLIGGRDQPGQLIE